MATGVEVVVDGDTGRIAAAALERFARSGYVGTTLADIADGAGLSEAQLKAEYATKDILVSDLTAALLDRLEALVRVAGGAATGDRVEAARVLGAYLRALSDYRSLVEVFLGDPAAAACPAVSRLRGALTGLRDALAGPAGDATSRIRASSALGAVQQAVADFTDAELVVARAVIIETAVAILGEGGQ